MHYVVRVRASQWNECPSNAKHLSCLNIKHTDNQSHCCSHLHLCRTQFECDAMNFTDDLYVLDTNSSDLNYWSGAGYSSSCLVSSENLDMKRKKIYRRKTYHRTIANLINILYKMQNVRRPDGVLSI